MREALLKKIGFENAPVQSKQGVQLTPLAAIQVEPAGQKQPALAPYQIPRGSSFAEELCPPYFATSASWLNMVDRFFRALTLVGFSAIAILRARFGGRSKLS